jgi:hypothetical protein
MHAYTFKHRSTGYLTISILVLSLCCASHAMYDPFSLGIVHSIIGDSRKFMTND